MLTVGSYVYNVQFGIGRVVKLEEYPKVQFEEITASFDEAKLTPISKDTIENIKNMRYREFFDSTTFQRGNKYYHNGQVDGAILMNNTASGIVFGSDDYHVNITFSKNTIRTRCSCPVGILCKHSLALLEYLHGVVDSLDTVESSYSSNELTDEAIRLVKDLDDWNRRGNPLLSAAIAFSEYLEDKDIDFYEALINHLNMYYRGKLYAMNVLKRIIIFNDAYYQKFLGIRKEVLRSFFGSEIVRLHDSSMGIIHQGRQLSYAKRYGDEIIFPFYIANKEYNLLIQLLFANHSEFSIEEYLPELLPKVDLTENIINQYIGYVNRMMGDIPSITSLLSSYMTKEKKKEFYSRSRYLSISLDYIKNHSFYEQMNILLSQKLSSNQMEYIIDKYYTFREIDKKLAYNLLFKLGYTQMNYRPKVVALLKESKGTEIFINYLKTKVSYDYSSDSTYEYVDFQYGIVESETYFQINYYIVLGGIPIYVCNRKSNEDFEGNGITAKEREIVRRIEAMPKFIEELNRTKESIRRKAYEAKRKEYESALLDFEDGIGKKEILLAERNKMRLEVTISGAMFYSYFGYSLSFRTGKDKLYVVKDAIEFLDAVFAGETIKYGKGLEFNHQIDNFDDEARAVLEYLISLPYDSFQKSSRKDLMVSDSILSGLLQVMKGSTIILYGEEMRVCLSEITPRICIDKEYLLTSSLKDSELLDLGKLYIVDKVNKCVDYVGGNDKLLSLYRFVYNNEGMDVSVVKEMFIETVYARFTDFIQIAEEIQNDFYMSELRLDLYFDYENPIITYRLELFKDNQFVLKESLSTMMEKSRVAVLERYLDSLGFSDRVLSNEEDIYNFFMMDFSYLRQLANVYLSDSIQNKTIQRLDNPVVRIQYNNSMMEMFMEESEYTEEELYQILMCIRKKKKFALLKDDRIIDLDNESAKEMLEVVEDLQMDPKHVLTKQDVPFYTSLKAVCHKESCSVDSYVTSMMDEIVHFKDSTHAIPNVNATLREYQKEGYKWMSILSKYNLGGILADDMGLGKTLEMITLFKGDTTPMPSLIVCPKSLVFNWISEFLKFDPDTRVVNIFGSQAQRRAMIQAIPRDEKVIYITGYDSVRMDIDEYQGKIFNYLVLDEAQAIKNVNAEKSKSVKSLSSVHRYALTGTPIENSVLDLWSIFDFLMPGYFPELSVFKSKYENNESYTKSIAKKTAPFILRRTKEEVLKDLPSKFERILSADMTKEQKKVYDAHIYEAKKKMELGLGAFDMLPYLLRLRQICVAPSLFLEDFSEESGKMSMLRDILSEYIPLGHRILIFSSFVKALEMVEKHLNYEGIEYMKITGDTKASSRVEMVEEFNKNESIKVFLISLKAGGTGLNLVGADTVIHLDPWWNISAENQATDRAHRIGQKRNVEVIKLVCEDSIEQKVIELQNMKKDIIDKIIAKDDSAITGLSLEDLRFILE